MYDAALERYIPVLMAMARIYWDRENYPMVEKLFRQAAEFCSDHDTWKLNAAHVFFMEEKFKVRASLVSCASPSDASLYACTSLQKRLSCRMLEDFGTYLVPNTLTVQEAIRYYEPIVKKQADNILEVPAIVLANLCVSHIMISQNEEAEELMRKVGDLQLWPQLRASNRCLQYEHDLF